MKKRGMHSVPIMIQNIAVTEADICILTLIWNGLHVELPVGKWYMDL